VTRLQRSPLRLGRPARLGAVALALLALFGGAASTAWADPSPAGADAASPATPMSPEGVLLAAVGVLVGVAGIGCAVAVLGAVVPRLSASMERQTREGGSGSPFLYGSLVLVGLFAALAGAARVHPHVAGALAVLLGVPASLLILAGSLGTYPVLGERLLGERGASASPVRRCVTAALALGLGLAPSLALHLYPLAFLLGLAATGWPLGVGLAAALGRLRRPRASPPAAA